MKQYSDTDFSGQPGTRLELEICDLNVDGGAVARRDGRVYFVDRGLPGEKLEAELTGAKKRVLLARALRTISPSPDAVRPFCRYFGSCGGCAFQDLAYLAQLRFKQQRAAQALARIGGLDRYRDGALLPEIIPSPLQSAYRNKMEYAFGRPELSDSPEPAASPVSPASPVLPASPVSPAPAESSGVLLGLKRRASAQVLDIEACPLQSPAAAEILLLARHWVRRHGFSAWQSDASGGGGCLRSLVVREPAWHEAGGPAQRSVELVCGSELPTAEAVEELWQALRGLGVSSFLLSAKTAPAGHGGSGQRLRLYGAPRLREAFGPLLLDFPLEGFAQTNTAAAALLYQRAAAYAGLQPGRVLWDIYSGAGALALYIGKEAGQVLGVEQDKAAVRAARANAARLGYAHCRFEAGEAARLLPLLADQLERGSGADKLARPDVLVLDPPRSGLSGRVLEGILKVAPTRLVYVSCDPANLARDLAGLGKKYELRDLTLVDMFPHTPHLEAVAVLEKR